MFKSIEYLRWDGKNYIYKLVDDDFEIEADAAPAPASTAAVIAVAVTARAAIKAYLSKSYSPEQIGENYALLIIWHAEKYNWTIENLINYHNKYLTIDYPDLKDTYEQIKPHRDKYLRLFVLFQ